MDGPSVAEAGTKPDNYLKASTGNAVSAFHKFSLPQNSFSDAPIELGAISLTRIFTKS